MVAYSIGDSYVLCFLFNSGGINMKSICDCCCGDGYIQMSCCGDDMKGRWEDNDCCPSCGEHCGEPDPEKCDECDGTGKENT